MLRSFPEVLSGRRQGRPRRDRHRPLAARHDRDDHQPPRPRRLAEAEAPLRRRRASDPGRALASLEAKGLLQGRAARRAREPGQRRGHGRCRAGSTPRSATWPCSGSTSSAPTSASELVGAAVDSLLDRVDPPLVRRAARRPPSGRSCSRRSHRRYGDRLALEPRFDDVTALVKDASRRLVALGVLRDDPELLAPTPSPLEQAADAAGDLLGIEKRDPLHAHHRRGSSRSTRPPSRSGSGRSTGSSSTAPWGSPPGPRSRS